jgi:phage terminase small subunit
MARKLTEKQQKWVRYLGQGYNKLDAALKAGYSEGYARTTLYIDSRNNPRLQAALEAEADKSIKHALAIYKTNLLSRVLELDEKVIEQQLADPKLAMMYPKVAERIHKIAGTIREVAPEPQRVNIKNLQVVMQMMAPGPGQQGLALEDIIDVEAVKVEDEKEE